MLRPNTSIIIAALRYIDTTCLAYMTTMMMMMMMIVIITLVDNDNYDSKDDREDATSRLSSNADSKILASSVSLPKKMMSMIIVILIPISCT